jgi:hypothetical protein
MTFRPTRAALPAFLLVGALAVAACGGSAESPTATTSAGSSAAPGSPAPSAGATAPATSDPGAQTATPDATDPGIDISDATGALEGVDSYRMTIAVDGEEVFTAVVVREPVEARAITDLRDVDRGHRRRGVDRRLVRPALHGRRPDGCLRPDPPVRCLRADGPTQRDDRPGHRIEERRQRTARYRIDDTNPVLGASLPPGAAMDIWAADAGYLVAYVVSGVEDAGGDLSLDITNINDPANTVERP